MQESFRPSKQFLIRGAVALGILLIILMVQTDWFRALLHKPPLPPVVSDKTVGEFIVKDSNQNGTPDWEEKLWGLDPTALYTNGVPNAQIIEERKHSLGIPAEGSMPENETDALARQLFTITAALGESGELTDESLAAVGRALADSVEFQAFANHYSPKDLRTVQTTDASLRAYYSTFSALATTYAKGASELEIIVPALETGDFSRVGELTGIAASYDRYAKALLALSVPVGLQQQHLEIINSIYGYSVALGYLQELSDNGANALAGVALYKMSDARLFIASEEVRSYLVRYGILEG